MVPDGAALRCAGSRTYRADLTRPLWPGCRTERYGDVRVGLWRAQFGTWAGCQSGFDREIDDRARGRSAVDGFAGTIAVRGRSSLVAGKIVTGVYRGARAAAQSVPDRLASRGVLAPRGAELVASPGRIFGLRSLW